MAIVATVGSASANSYCTLETAQAHFDGRLDVDAWNTAGTERQEKALLTAMRALKNLPYIGQRATTTQALDWPRIGQTKAERGWGLYHGDVAVLGAYEGLYDLDGRKWAATQIPTPIISAQCEIALAMLTDASWIDPDTVADAVFWAGSVRIQAGDSKKGKLPATVAPLLSGLLTAGVELMRG